MYIFKLWGLLFLNNSFIKVLIIIAYSEIILLKFVLKWKI